MSLGCVIVGMRNENVESRAQSHLRRLLERGGVSVATIDKNTENRGTVRIAEMSVALDERTEQMISCLVFDSNQPSFSKLFFSGR